MKKTGLIVLYCLFYTTLSAQWNTSNMLRRGQDAIFDDDYVTAIEKFNQVIRIKPHLAEPYFSRGLAKLNLDDYNGALGDFSKAIDLDMNYFHAYAYRGIVLRHLKRYEEAMSDFNTAISINSRHAYVYANRAITEADMGDYKAAEEDYTKALIIDNKFLPVYLNRAVLREKQGDMEGAMADCNAAIQLNMLSDDAFGLRGYLMYQQALYHDAIEDYNRGLKANPENIRLLMSRAIAWYEMKQYTEALADYTRVLKLDSTYIYAYYNRGLLLAEVGDYKNAIRDMDEVLLLNRDNILIYFNRGLLKMESRDMEGAYYDFSASIALYPDFVNAYLARASVSVRMGDYLAAERDHHKADEILDRYRKMQAGVPNALVDTTENFRRLVDINSRTDRIREVINGRLQDKNVIVELQPVFVVQYIDLDTLRAGRPQYFNRHIMAYNQQNNYTPALTVSNRYFHFTDAFLDEQITCLTERVEKTRSDVDAFLLRGIFHLYRNDFTKSIEDFKAVLEREPDHLFARFNLANARIKMYDYIESVEAKTARVVGDEEQIKRTVDYSLVLEDYERCLSMDPDFVYVLFNIANIYAKNREVEEAIARYTQVLEKDGNIAEAYYNRGLLYIYKGDKAMANADLSKAGELGLMDAYAIIKQYCSETE